MKLFGVIKWTLFIVIASAIAVATASVWLWRNGDQLLQEKLVERFEKAAPGLVLHIDRTVLANTSKVVLHGIQIRDRETNRPLARAGQITVQLDEKELLSNQKIVVTSVHIRRADILLTRKLDGRWNWQGYEFIPESKQKPLLPVISFEDTRAFLSLEHGVDLPPAGLTLISSGFQAVPKTSAQYDFIGDVTLPGAGVLSLRGAWDLSERIWSLDGRLRDVQAGQQLVDLAQSASPGVTAQLEQLDEILNRALPSPVLPEDAPSAALTVGTSPKAPRVSGVLDVDFQIRGTPLTKVPEFRLKVDIRNGMVACAAIPDRLTDLRATMFWDNQNVIVRVDECRDAGARLSGQVEFQLGPEASLPHGHIKVENLAVDDRFRPLFPEKSQQFFSHFKPKGLVTGEADIRRSSAGKWYPENLQATFEDGEGEFHKFRYPIKSVRAEIRQRAITEAAGATPDIVLDIKATGMAGTRPVTAEGVVRNPGPMAEMGFEVKVTELPLDSRFRDALNEAGRKVVDALNVTGVGDGTARCYRAPGLDQPTTIQLDTVVRNASMRFSKFPYDITSLTGRITFDSRENLWTFHELQGMHGEGRLFGKGTYRGKPLPGVLDLTVTAKNGSLDADLYNALGQGQRSLWSLLQPTGRVNLTTAIHWTNSPGQRAIVTLPEVEVLDGTIYPKPFPYRMNVRSAKFSFDPNDPRYAGVQHCEILSFFGDHNGAPITASGWAEINADQFWQLHLNDVNATEISPDDELRAAMPSSWRTTLSHLAPGGRISIEDSQLDFRGQAGGELPPTAAWELNLRMRDCGITAGLDLSKIFGMVMARGNWNGYELKNSGSIRLDSLEVLKMPLTRIIGPYEMTEKELVLGSRDAMLKTHPHNIPTDQQIQAQAYQGTLQLDALVDLQSGQNYQVFAELQNARLEAYAARHLPEERNLQGVINSWIYLTGTGDSARDARGRGQMKIEPAALYELPLMLELFAALGKLNFNVPNRSAFDYAFVDFKVEDGAFQFNPIDLVGASIALRGRGTIGLEGDVVLDFYSRPALARTPTAPLINTLLFTGATQWVGVEVRGTTNRPQTRIKTAIRPDESMKQFLSGFQPIGNGQMPTLVIPNLLSLPLRGPGFGAVPQSEQRQ
ncbi:MAG: hypothetical protein JNL58_09880 [Planctomyces sp.]|nr:hypothetical protein [Planctomyces sp.]